MKMTEFSANCVMLCILLTSLNSNAVEMLKEQDGIGPGYLPKEGFVPDRVTALSIATAVLTPIYGKKVISGEQPLMATLKGGIWVISGSLPAGHVGGVAELQIDKMSGRILRVAHGK